METQIGVVCNRPSDWDWLIKVREWMRTEGPTSGRALVNPVTPLGKALIWRDEMPGDRLIVTVGFKRQELDGIEFLAGRSGEPVILCEPDGAQENGLASASFADNQAIVTCKDVFPFLKKSLIRSSLRRQFEIRPPVSAEEWNGYFSLRYRVWKECNFLREENKRAQIQWEIDWKDRMAIPLCAITPAGKVVGCARVLRSFGQEQQPYVSQITKLLGETGDTTLQKLFNFPNSLHEPFDLLMEFPGFRAHYKALMQDKKVPGEISRVAVDPDYRGQSLSEALVDTAVSYATAKHLAPVFLACREELAPLYGNCGFAPVRGLKSAKYLNIQLASIVMERPIW